MAQDAWIQDLNTILNDQGSRALVEEYLSTDLLERKDWDGVLANSNLGAQRGIPMHKGQYVKWTKKGHLRRPQNLNIGNSEEATDPAGGAKFDTDILQYPIEAFQDFIEISTMARHTSWIDLKSWAREDLMLSLKRRMHELSQNAFVAGRFQPFLYAADGTKDIAADSVVEATAVSLWGVSFNFQDAPKYYAGGVETFNDLDTAQTKATWADMARCHTKLANAKARKIVLSGRAGYAAVMSEAMHDDLLEDAKYRDHAIRNDKIGDSLVMNHVSYYRGWHIIIDDQPFTEESGAELARADYGPIHSAFLFGKDSWGYVPLQGQSSLRPKLKIQDVSKTGVSMTIGYTVPWQSCVIERPWAIHYRGYVSEHLPNAADETTKSAALDGFSVSTAA